MNVQQAREIARQWVQEEGIKLPGSTGAFLHGSTNWLSDEAELPASSDIDVLVVLTGSAPSEKLGKFLWRGVLLEVSYLPVDQVQSAEQILGSVPLAGSFRRPGILADTSGHLTQIQKIVSLNYAKRYWVEKRCEQARGNVLNVLSSLSPSAPFHDQVMSWLFATGITTHILLSAGLKNPTVRRRYVDTKELLTAYHHPDFYKTLLEMLGCAQMSRESAEQHLDNLAAAFDTTRQVIKTPYRFAADLTEESRPVAIDGSRELIQRGLHREAIFWITATYSRCQWVLAHDATSETQERFTQGYRYLLNDLGITSFADMERRGVQVREALPAIWAVVEAIMAANPKITE